MKTIFFFVKFFDDEKYVNDFISGKIYANRLSYFKKIEENGDFSRIDRHEGVFGWFQPNLSRLVINGMDITGDLAGPVEMQREWLDYRNVFCIYAAHSGDLDLRSLSSENIDRLRKQLKIPPECLKLGKFAVIVKNIPEFIERMKAASVSRNYQHSHSFVKYYDPIIFHGHFSDLEAVFRKRNEYAYQQEYRFVIDTLITGNGPITLDIGNISDITIRANSTDINKEFLGGEIKFML